jgi:hypothetical protein
MLSLGIKKKKKTKCYWKIQEKLKTTSCFFVATMFFSFPEARYETKQHVFVIPNFNPTSLFSEKVLK